MDEPIFDASRVPRELKLKYIKAIEQGDREEAERLREKIDDLTTIQWPSGDGDGTYMIPFSLGGIKKIIKRQEDEERTKDRAAASHTSG